MARERPYLVSPGTGYPRIPDPGQLRAVEELYRKLVEGRKAAAGIRHETLELLEKIPSFHPAIVLLAQAELVEGLPAQAKDRLIPVVQHFPEYSAAQTALGRAAENLGEIPDAYGAYLAAAGSVPAAARRADELLGRTAEILSARARDSAAKGDVPSAVAELERLRLWAPDSTLTLRAEADVAAARGDIAAELAAVSRLADTFPDDGELRQRHADLEIRAGDAGVGLRILQRMAAEDPQNRELRDRLERAKFRWRMQLLPPEVRSMAQFPVLRRADLAVMIYWLFPEVRYGRASSATIASDILDHVNQEEIVRVVNQGLLSVDPNLHRFDPERQAIRGELLRALVRLMSRKSPALGCLEGEAVAANAPWQQVCRLAAECGLEADVSDCLPGAPVSGEEAIDLFAKSLDKLGTA